MRSFITPLAVLAAVTFTSAQTPITVTRTEVVATTAITSGSSTRQPEVTATTATSASSSITAVTDCHLHGATQYCMVGTSEYQVLLEATATTELPTEYTGCHNHASELFCIAPDGSEVQLEAEGAHDDEGSGDAHADEATGGQNCHFHAGVEHCVGEAAATCERVDRDYNIPLRIGLLFVILVTSGLGAFVPIFLTSLTKFKTTNIVFTILKQFGTGIIISTAFVHLYTHAYLMFTNECLGELDYEATTSAIVMAGIFVSFLIEYIGHRFVDWRSTKRATSESISEEVAAKDAQVSTSPVIKAAAVSHAEPLNVIVLEGGILFHSVLIGLTLVVAGDSFFLTLFAVILFHQMFEGIALGTRIAELTAPRTSFAKKMLMAATFTLSTPLGMAIGIGVLSSYNGGDRSTILAIGTLDAFSAGILVWVGVVEMWAHDWLHGEMKSAGPVKTVLGLSALVIGMIAMSVLGKWA